MQEVDDLGRVVNFDDQLFENIVADDAANFPSERSRKKVNRETGHGQVHGFDIRKLQRVSPEKQRRRRAGPACTHDSAARPEAERFSQLRIDYRAAGARIQDEPQRRGIVHSGLHQD